MLRKTRRLSGSAKRSTRHTPRFLGAYSPRDAAAIRAAVEERAKKKDLRRKI